MNETQRSALPIVFAPSFTNDSVRFEPSNGRLVPSMVITGDRDTMVSGDAPIDFGVVHEFSVGYASEQLALQRAVGEVVGDSEALELLGRVVELGELDPSLASPNWDLTMKLAAASLAFAADRRLFPTVSGIALVETLRAQFSGGEGNP